MKIHAVVFYDTEQLEPLKYKIYDHGTSKYEQKFVTEFVNFGRKDFLKRMKAPDKEFVINLAGGSVLVYVTALDGLGVAMMLSNVVELDEVPHIVSKKLINDYMKYDIVPESSNDILVYFRQKEILAEVQKTKKVLMRTLSKVIERGENIEDLIEKTDELSATSKVFFKNSRKLNSCCWIFPRPRWSRK